MTIQDTDDTQVHLCEMCAFLINGYQGARSKQAKAEYGEGFITHCIAHHPSTFPYVLPPK